MILQAIITPLNDEKQKKKKKQNQIESNFSGPKRRKFVKQVLPKTHHYL